MTKYTITETLESDGRWYRVYRDGEKVQGAFDTYDKALLCIDRLKNPTLNKPIQVYEEVVE